MASNRSNVGTIIAVGAAVGGVAALWYVWWVWYQGKQQKAAPKTATLSLAPEKSEHPEDEVGGVGFWGDPIAKPTVETASIGTLQPGG